MDGGHICICCDSSELRQTLCQELAAHGHRVASFDAGDAVLRALEHLQADRLDLVLLEVDGPGQNGLEVLRGIKAAWPEQAVVMTSCFATVAVAVAAMKLGALDFLMQPFVAEALLELVDQQVERNRLAGESRSSKDAIRRRFDPDQVIYRSQAFGRVFEMARRVAATDASVLIQGESGTGKELIASTIHYSSRRSGQRFLTVNCAALTETLLESQLFGHRKGSFTGAVSSQRGLVEEADGGTLFLDEIGDVSPGLQAKLLRVLQEREFLPVGATRARRADVRFVAATNKDLEGEVAQGRFREDLFYRLSVITVHVPPLRERPDDIMPLAEFFLAGNGSGGPGLSAAAVALLQAYRWPGNVRELENVVEMATILSAGEEITPDHLPDKLSRGAVAKTVPEWEASGLSLEEVEAQYIERVFQETGYHKVNTAKLLQISRSTLDRKMRQYAIAKEEAPPRRGLAVR